MLKWGWQYLASKRRRCGYEKLSSSGEKMMMRGGRRCWVKSVNGRLRGLRLSRCRKLSLAVVLFSSRIVRLYTEVVKRMNMENIYPAIVLSTQWGLPVLSHSSHVCRSRRAIPLHTKLTFFLVFSLLRLGFAVELWSVVAAAARIWSVIAVIVRLWKAGRAYAGRTAYGGGNGRCYSTTSPHRAIVGFVNHTNRFSQRLEVERPKDVLYNLKCSSFCGYTAYE
ncbi:hypothetical protein VNO80_04586 [Phaseolus coccineus]|uniref:Uncharacterized protein n=1 Tax=Phaseolus coccineus TaxID=3886 RepID=A0AAN9P138_PHACN